MLLLDSGAPVNNTGKPWLKGYTEEYGIDINQLKRIPCHQIFKFGASRFLSEEIVEIPINMKDKDGKIFSAIVSTYILDANTPFLLGKKQMKDWKAILNLGEDEMVISTNNVKRVFKMIEGNHPMIELQMESEEEEVVLFIDNNVDKITSYKGVKKVHEIHDHKYVTNLLHAYKVADLLTPELKTTVNRVVKDCKICQKFKKSVPRPQVTLPKSTDFNQIVTLDLKEISGKYILWIICSFSRFMQGVLTPNKRAETVIKALNET